MDKVVGGSNLVLAEAGEVNRVDCTEVVANPVPVCMKREGSHLRSRGISVVDNMLSKKK